MRFQADYDGTINGIRYYKAPDSVAPHQGHLWDNSGNLLGTVTYSNETAQGWQEADFTSPVSITANTVYVASYSTPNDYYWADGGYFLSAGVDSPPLHALKDGVSGSNGIFGNPGVFPTNTYGSTNYWVDVVYVPSTTAMLNSIAVAPGNPTLQIGQPQQFTATGTYSDNSTKDLTTQVTWTSSITNVATVSSSGLATSVAGGASNVVATLGTVSGSTTLTVVAAPLSITTTTLPTSQQNLPYSVTLAATGGVQPYTWSLAAGSLPAGLSLASNGTISGTPTTSTGTASFTVQVKDSASQESSINQEQTATQNLSISIISLITIWPATTVPTVVDGNDPSAVELGVKFQSDVSGPIYGIRFYKSAANTGPHVAHLWDSSGDLLGTANFTNETAFGWQEADFATPVEIAANTVYVASYHTSVGHYSADVNYFATAGVDNPPLHALANGVSGSNGVYMYGATSAFPTSAGNGTNYWVDVAMLNSAATLSSIAVNPANPTPAVGSQTGFTATGTYSDGSTRNLTDVVTWASSNTAVATINTLGTATEIATGSSTISATLGAVSGSTTLSVQPPALVITTSSLTDGLQNQPYSATLAASGGLPPYIWSLASGTLPAGLSLATNGQMTGTPSLVGSSTFTVQVQDSSSQTVTKSLSLNIDAPPDFFTIWPATTVPTVVDGNDPSAVELGVKFQSDVSGPIYGIRFYKSAANTGPHVAHLWDSSGDLLGTANFTNETAFGWQEADFATPVEIAANTVYVASYHTSVGHYSADVNYFATAGVDNPPLHALANGVSGSNGVYMYGATSAFPTSAGNGTNYWVDVAMLNSAATLSSIAVNPANPTPAVGSQTGFTATGTYSDGSTRNLTDVVTWASSNTAVATINTLGTATEIATGSSTISATLGAVSGSTTLSVQPPALVITTSSLTDGLQNQPYSATLAASGGLPPYIWSLASGTLPAGLSLATNGQMTGTPSLVGSSTFTVQVQDSSSQTVTKSLSLNIDAPPDFLSIWSPTVVPATLDAGPDHPLELGVKFRSDVSGSIQGIRFYKSANNTGTHIGNLWDTSGDLLASVTFSNETASGWQQANFATPVAITANTEYVASYHTTVGDFSFNAGYFTNAGVDNPPLHAPQNSTSDSNGAYAYDSSTCGGALPPCFPNTAANGKNYWVDVAFVPASSATLSSIAVTPVNPTLQIGQKDAFTAIGTYSDNSTVNITDTVTWSSSNTSVASVNSIGSASGVAGGSATITATLGSISGNTTATVQAAPLAITATALPAAAIIVPYSTMLTATGGVQPYTWSLASGSLPAGLTLSPTGQISGTPQAATTSSFTVQVTDSGVPQAAINPQQTATQALSITTSIPAFFTIWPTTAAPTTPDGGDANAVEVGVRFRADTAGIITGIRFYKSANNTGTHVGDLWSSTGSLLATATFTNEAASGWQQVNFSTPVPIATNTMYVASYHTTVGHYATDLNYFANAGVDNAPLHALQNGVSGADGVFTYDATAGCTPSIQPCFPASSFNSANYWVDVVFQNTFAISGTISGPGASGATVNLSGAANITTTANASGSYTFAGLTNGAYTVLPSNPGFGFTPNSQSVTLANASVTGVNFGSIVTYTISGTISGTGGNGATVTLTGAATATATANASGNYTFPSVVSGTYTVTPSISGFGFAPNSLNVTVASANVTGVNFSSTVTYGVSGTVSGPGGNGATVNLTGAATVTDASNMLVYSQFDASSLGFSGGTKNEWEYYCDHATYTANTTDLTDPNGGNTAMKLVGPATGGSCGTLAAGIQQVVSGESAGNTYTLSVWARGALGGEQLHLGIQSGNSCSALQTLTTAWVRYSCSVTTTGTPAGYQLSFSNQPNVTVYLWGAQLEPRATVGVYVHTTRAPATMVMADGSGNYSFTGLANGTYTVTPTSSTATYTPASQSATVNNANVTGLNFSTVTYSLSGTISGAGGNGTTVTLTGAATATTTANASGGYTFTGLGNGSYTVTPSITGFSFTPSSQAATINNANLTSVNFSTVTYSISGTISGTGGNGATVNLIGAATATVTANVNGNYTFTGLNNGAYTVTPSPIGFAFTPLSQATTVNNANVSGVNFSSTPTYSISGTISGPGGNGATVTLTGAATATVNANASGNYSFTGLYNGAYTVKVSNTGVTFTPTSQSATINSANVSGVNFNTVTYTISGTISGTGGSGATVNVTGTLSASAIANASGNYTVVGLVNGTYAVTPSNPGFGFTPNSQSVTIASANVTGVNYSSTVTYSVSGTITGGSGATVNLAGAATVTDTSNMLVYSQFDASSLGFSGGTKNEWEYYCDHATYTANTTDLTDPNGGNTAMKLVGPATGGSCGTLATGIQQVVSGESAGNTYTLSVWARGALGGEQLHLGIQSGNSCSTLQTLTAAWVRYSCSVTTTGTPAGYQLSFSNQPNVTVYLWGAQLEPRPTVGVYVHTTSAQLTTVTADGSGNYSFTGLANGTYTVTPTSTVVTYAPASQSATVNNANITGLNFSTAYSLSGTISGVGGNSATVSVTGAATATTTANVSGGYTITGLPNGAYTVTANNPGFIFTPASQAATVNSANVTGVNFTSTAAYNLSGTISGPGASGATVKLTGAATATTTANASGSYTFTNLNNGAYTVTVSQTGFAYTPASQAVTISNANLTGVNFSTVTYTISGTISGTGGNGAIVNLTGAATATATANASGSYTFSGLVNGAYTVTPSNPGFGFAPNSLNVTVASANVTGVNFSSTVTYGVSGTVSGPGGNGATVNLTGAATATDSSNMVRYSQFDSAALPGSGPWAYFCDHATYTANTTDLTDPNGGNTAMKLVGPATGGSCGTLATGIQQVVSGESAGNTYTLSVWARGALGGEQLHLGIQSGNSCSALQTLTIAWVRYSCSVTTTGTPAGYQLSFSNQPNVTVYLWGAQLEPRPTVGVYVHTTTAQLTMVTADASGNYSFTGLANGTYTVTPTSSTATYTPANQSATVNSANVTGLNFSTSYSLSGTISGAGGNGATVTLSGAASATTTASSTGTYTFSNLANGSYTVTPSALGFSFTPASQAVSVSNANVANVNFSSTVAFVYSISGTISGAGGNGATVTLSGAASATVTASSTGTYTFSNLANGSYTVTPSKTGFTFTPASQPATISNASVAGLNFSTVTYTISGTISGTGGNGATVTLSGAASATTTASSTGTYTFSNLVNGSCTVTPSKTGFTFTPASQPATISNASVTGLNFSTVTYSISGTISGTGGNGATVNLTGAAAATVTADGSGNYTFAGLTNGTYTVIPTNSGFGFAPNSLNVTVASANVTGVNFSSTVTYGVSGTVSGPGGNGATVNLTGAATVTDASNMLVYSQFDASSLGFSGGTKNEWEYYCDHATYTANTTDLTDPNGGNTAMKLVGPATGGSCGTLATGIQQVVSGESAGNTYTLSVWARGALGGEQLHLGIQSGNSCSALQTLTIAWVRYSCSVTTTGTPAGYQLSFSNQPGVTVYLWGAQLEPRPTVGVYVHTTSAQLTTVTADGSGNYSFTGLANGTYMVTPTSTSVTYTPASQSATVNNANITGLNFSASQ